MSGLHSFKKLREKIERDPERRERMEEKRKAYDAVMSLAERREAKGLTQAELAARLGVSQPNVSKLEAAAANPHAGAIFLSTLGGYIAALGFSNQRFMPLLLNDPHREYSCGANSRYLHKAPEEERRHQLE